MSRVWNDTQKSMGTVSLFLCALICLMDEKSQRVTYKKLDTDLCSSSGSSDTNHIMLKVSFTNRLREPNLFVYGEKPYNRTKLSPHNKPTLLPSGALRNIRSSVNDLIQKVAIPKHSDKKITAGYHGHRIRSKRTCPACCGRVQLITRIIRRGLQCPGNRRELLLGVIPLSEDSLVRVIGGGNPIRHSPQDTAH
ncbi:hypothetical protein CDAR_586561 [Caerostris darwini]|uniref:Uncharacterized protein n=1 Tax=Caerostris darwini TaxID=1538125 RepID=A0AAV4QD28_9ARAC|nr:hypothetical protein CDAR_586561 [Caerostris darwini]